MATHNPTDTRSGYRLGLQLAPIVIVCALVFLLPIVLDNDFLLNKARRYLVFGMLCDGAGAVLGLCRHPQSRPGHELRPRLLCMAMALKLRTVPVQTGSDGLPDFMVWNNVEGCPGSGSRSIRWPSRSLPAWSIPAAGRRGPRLVHVPRPGHRRLCRDHHAGDLVVVNLVIIDQQRYTGGFNGITDLAQLELVRHRLRRLRPLHLLSRRHLPHRQPAARLRRHQEQGRVDPAGDPRP